MSCAAAKTESCGFKGGLSSLGAHPAFFQRSLFLDRARKKKGLQLGTGSPERHVSYPASFSHRMRGVIHPSFPLRGRW